MNASIVVEALRADPIAVETFKTESVHPHGDAGAATAVARGVPPGDPGVFAPP